MKITPTNRRACVDAAIPSNDRFGNGARFVDRRAWTDAHTPLYLHTEWKTDIRGHVSIPALKLIRCAVKRSAEDARAW